MKFKILIPVYNDWQSVSELLDNIDHNLSGIDMKFQSLLSMMHQIMTEKKRTKLLKILIQLRF